MLVSTHDNIPSAQNRSSHLEVFCQRSVLKDVAKFTGKHLRQNLFFNKVTVLRSATLVRKRPWHRCFPMNFTMFLRTSFYRTPLVAASYKIKEIIELAKTL